MSNLFDRPKPHKATAYSVVKAIEEIQAWDWQTGYSFAHVVLGDQNLGDGHILYCMRPSWVAEVMEQRIRDEFGGVVNFDSLEKWEWRIYYDHAQHMAEILDLLNWLYEVPEEVRDEAECMFHGCDEEEVDKLPDSV